MNYKISIYLILILTINSFLYSQEEELKGKIYSDFLKEYIPRYDSTFNRTTKSVFVSSLKNITDLYERYDINYLEDYLNDNLENNTQYRGGWEPNFYFNSIMWGGFGEILEKHPISGKLLIKLLKKLEHKFKLNKRLINNTGFEIKYNKSNIPKSSKWDEFHNKYKNCYGFIYFSDIVFSDDKQYAMFYKENYKYSLAASGDVVLMKFSNGNWKIIAFLNGWIS